MAKKLKVKGYKFGIWASSARWSEVKRIELKNGWTGEINKAEKMITLFTPNKSASFCMCFETASNIFKAIKK